MTELARELLEGLGIGDRVTVRYGTLSDQESVTGIITKLTENVLTLDNGRVRLLLDDSLRAVEKKNIDSSMSKFELQPVQPAKQQEFKITRKIISLPPEKIYTFNLQDWFEKIKSLQRNIDNLLLKNKLNGIIESWKNALKNNDLPYKYHDLRAKILNTWEDCNAESDYKIFYLLLGILSVAAKKYTDSFEPLIRGREYSLAAYAADAANHTEYAKIFIFCNLLSGKNKEINQRIAKICSEIKDVNLVREILNANKNDAEFCEKIVACAFEMFETSKSKLNENIDSKLTAYEAADKLLNTISDDWKSDSGILKYWQEYNSYEYPAPQTVAISKQNERLIGKIFQYGPQVFGRITPNYGFHVGQIPNYSEPGILLRKVLAVGLWRNLEVSFTLGERLNQSGQVAASGIELTDNGYNEVERRLQGKSNFANRQSGKVEAYFPLYNKGKIRSAEDRNIYYFKLEDIADPWLKAFYKNLESNYVYENQYVTFEVLGKNTAINICLKDANEFDKNSYNNYVTLEERQNWEIFLAELNKRSKQITLPEEDPYQNIKYIALQELKTPSKALKPSPLRWSKDSICEMNSKENLLNTELKKNPVILKPKRNFDETVISDSEDNEDINSSIPKFILDKLKEIKISSRLKSKNLKGEKYIGLPDEVRADVDRLTFGRQNKKYFLSENIGRTAENRSNDIFAACKLVIQIEQDDPSIFENNHKRILAGRAISSWGDYMISECSQMDMDTSRMAWLYAISLLPSNEQDWINDYNRYLKSFTLPQNGDNSMESYIHQQINSGKNDSLNTEFHFNLKLKFLTGILQLFSVLQNFPKQKLNLTKSLYNNKPKLQNALFEKLSAVLNTEKANSIKIFTRQIEDAITLMNKQRQKLQDVLNENNIDAMTERLPDNKLIELEPENWKLCLTSTDAERLRKVHLIFKRIQDYYDSSNFDNRMDCLTMAISYTEDLLKNIKKEPTIISYEIFYPMLEKLKKNISEKQSSLYQNFQPKLSWSEVLQPFRVPDGSIQIQLKIKNELHYQTADAFQIICIQGIQNSEVKLRDGGGVFSIRGGDEIEVGISVTIGDAENNSGSFNAKINYSYKCSDSPQTIVMLNKTEEFTFVIRKEDFKPLKNPLSNYIGKVMDNEKYFVGRTDEIERIITAISQDDGTMNYGHAIAMYGQTRTGKTSLIWHLKKKIKDKYGDKVLIWDIGNIGHEGANNQDNEESLYLSTFLHRLLYIGDEEMWNHDNLCQKLQQRNLNSPHDLILKEPKKAETLFNNYMTSLGNILRKENKMIVLIIDEFTYIHDQIKKGNISNSFMVFWKQMLQNYPIFAIIAGQDDMPEFIQEFPNEFMAMELLKLTYLKEIDAKKLIREPLENANERTDLFSNEEPIDEIYKLTAGSAFLTIVICANLVIYLNDKGAYKITKGIVNDFIRKYALGFNSFLNEANFEAQLQERGHRELDEVNKEILHCIAKLSKKTGYADLSEITCSGESSNTVKEWLKRLVDRDVLVNENGTHYWIQVKLLELWLLRTMGE